MAGLVPAIHVFDLTRREDVDARDKPGHDERNHNPICLEARSFMISSLPPPMALTLTSR
jgi:hypothetical protein